LHVAMSLRRTTVCLSALMAGPLAVPAAAEVVWSDYDAVVSLAVPWRFQAGDDLAWARPDYDDSGWRTIAIPAGSDRRYFVGVRTPPEMPRGTYSLEASFSRGQRLTPVADRLGPGIAKVPGTSATSTGTGARATGGVGPPLSERGLDRRGRRPAPREGRRRQARRGDQPAGAVAETPGRAARRRAALSRGGADPARVAGWGERTGGRNAPALELGRRLRVDGTRLGAGADRRCRHSARPPRRSRSASPATG